MSNITLAVKYRPKCFAEIVGQQAVVSILSKQVETNTFKNVYLFCGSSGCGKTSLARILANAINNGEGEPIEIDAASNNGVDNIRQLISDAQQMSIDSDYKTYIIDECHMLTTQAWNAALKLIEEPPTNTIFIFCTTNPEKIPLTIMSRVQRFDFKKISTEDIQNRLEYILNVENIGTYEKDALRKIADKSNGLMREAISMLDKCVDYSNEINVHNVNLILGFADDELLFQVFKSIIEKNVESALKNLNDILSSNTNPITILDNLLKYFIDANKIQLTHSVIYGSILEKYKDYLINIKEDIFPLVERIISYRKLSQLIPSEKLLEALFIELCRR